MKNRGFTLIEMLITFVVLSILLTAAMPRFSALNQKLKIQRLATEIEGIVSMARSEAVLKNQSMYLHLIGLNTTGVHGGWCLMLSESNSVTGCDDNPLYLVNAVDHQGMTVTQEITSNAIEFEPINGQPVFSSMGTDGYTDMLSMYKDATQPLMAKVHFFGRSKVCGVGDDWYGVKRC